MTEQELGEGGSADSLGRRRRMLSFIRARDFVRVLDLSRQFGVSEVTVRSDLDILARDGGVRRVRGGVMGVRPIAAELAFEARIGTHADDKRSIAAVAVDLVSSGDSIVLDVGTTTMAIAHALADRSDLEDVTVFTPGLNVALALERAVPRLQVIVTGGALRPQQHSLVEPFSTLILERIRASTAFVGCNGFDPELGVMAISLPDAALKQAILRAGRRRVVVADASKFTAAALVGVCPFTDIDLVLTAGGPDPDAVAAMREAGVEVRLCDEGSAEAG